jgi:hypothetical protein
VVAAAKNKESASAENSAESNAFTVAATEFAQGSQTLRSYNGDYSPIGGAD